MKMSIFSIIIVACSILFSGCNEQNFVVRYSRPGWLLSNDQIDVFVTRNGGHMAPVLFYKSSPKPIQPFYISPWQDEKVDIADPLLDTLRGDFFCMPFGANIVPYNGEKHDVHGDTATKDWNLVEFSKTDNVKTIVLDMNTVVRKGHVTKKISLIDGQNVLYVTHILEGFEGKMPIGHHAILSVPEVKDSLKISVGKFDLGMTNPTIFSNPANREYQSLAIGKTFTSLAEVPLVWKDPDVGDYSVLPQRLGFTDLLCIYKKPSNLPAWTTAVNEQEDFLWFALKDASIFPCTTMWISNKGRHGEPWNGRNRCLGLEETCAYFADGLAASVQSNIINRAGFPTAADLSPDKSIVINMIQGCVKTPEGFGKVKDVIYEKNSVRFISETGLSVTVDVNYDFIKTGKL